MTSPTPPPRSEPPLEMPETCPTCGSRIRSWRIEETRPDPHREAATYGGLPESAIVAEPCEHRLAP